MKMWEIYIIIHIFPFLTVIALCHTIIYTAAITNYENICTRSTINLILRATVIMRFLSLRLTLKACTLCTALVWCTIFLDANLIGHAAIVVIVLTLCRITVHNLVSL